MAAATPRDDDDDNDDNDDTGIGKMVPRTSSSSFPETIGRHGVIAEHTAHRTNDADGGWTNTAPHPTVPPPSGEPVHVIRGMLCVCVLFYLLCVGAFCVMAYNKSRVSGPFFFQFILDPIHSDHSEATSETKTRRPLGGGQKEDGRGRRGEVVVVLWGTNDEDDDDDDDKNANGGRMMMMSLFFGGREERLESDDAPPEEVSRAVAEKEVEEERVQKKRAVDAKQMEKATAKRMRLERAKEMQEAAAKRKREKGESKTMEGKGGDEGDEEQHEGEEGEEDPDAFMLDEDVVDAVAANENELKEKYLRDFHDTKSQRKKRKKQMKRERMREEAMGRQSAKFTTRDGFDVVIRSKVDELAEVKSNPKAVDFVQQKLNNKHRRDGRMLCDTRTGKIKNQFAVR